MMATLQNVHDRVRRLIHDGRLYYSQPSAKLREILQAESSHWKTVFLDGETRRWGTGPNEDLDSLQSAACELLYGDGSIRYERVQQWESLLPGVLKRAMRAVAESGRAEGSPYYVSIADLAEYLVARSVAGLADESLPADCKYWLVHDFLATGDVQLAEVKRWWGRYCHATGMPCRDVDWSKFRSRVRSKNFSKVLVAVSVFGDVETAMQFTANCATLREAIDTCKSAAALMMNS